MRDRCKPSKSAQKGGLTGAQRGARIESTEEKVMPLKKSTSKKAFSSNVAAEVKSGKKVAQAVAIAFAVKRRAKSKG